MAQIDFTNNYKNIMVKFPDGSIVSGKINTMSYSRLSDYLKSINDKFITVIHDELKGVPPKVTLINTEYIVWADTWDDPLSPPEIVHI